MQQQPHEFPANTWYYYSKSLDLTKVDVEDAKSLTIDIWETTAVLVPLLQPHLASLFRDKYLYLHIDNTTSGYGIVKLSGKGAVRRNLTLALVTKVMDLAVKPVVDYIVSRLNLGTLYTV